MGRINIPSESYNKDDSIDELLQKWQNIVRKIAHNAIPKKTGAQWLASYYTILTSDNGKEFTAIVIKELIKLWSSAKRD
ncbi:hypothetical protein C1645_820977 [Glomus cerebriforme]|uniref:Uncharacterized protein n=1 Tax=Glomus cerebriforme TaxID=658196 RepID=A0A397TBA3_9GLOM|nr:hypothetical protein C1645_820977 [Glomus cerebriforme]